MRTGLAIVVAVAGALGAAAGTFYDRTYFAGDVGIHAWAAPTNFAAGAATGGEYTNAATLYFRICGTNASGRTPWASNSIALGGGTESNAVALTWDRRDGITGYRLERSPDGATWTQGMGLSATALGYTDVAATNWTAGTNSLVAIAAPAVPWTSPGHEHSATDVTNLGTAATADVAASTWTDGMVPRIGTNTIGYSGLVVYDSDSGHVRQGTIDDAGNMRTSLALGTIALLGSNDYLKAESDAAWINLGPSYRLNSGVSVAVVPGLFGLGYAFVTNAYCNADWLPPASATATGVLLRTTWANLATEPWRQYYVRFHHAVSNEQGVTFFTLNPTNGTVAHSNGWGVQTVTNTLAYPFGLSTSRLSFSFNHPGTGQSTSNFLIRAELKFIYP